MSDLSNIITVEVSVTSPGVTREGFGTLGILTTADWSERSRVYSDMTGVAEDWDSGRPEYKYAAKAFAQSPRVKNIRMLRVANKPTQKRTITPAAAAGTTYALRIGADTVSVDSHPAWKASTAYQIGDRVVNDSGKVYEADMAGTSASSGGPTGTGANIADGTARWDYVSANLNDIVARLITAINALTDDTLTATGTTTLVLTADAAGDWDDVEVADPSKLSLVQDHADPGIADDLDAILYETRDWYALVNPWNSKLMAIAIADWMETRDKLFLADSQDSDTEQVAEGTSGADLAQAAHDANYTHTAVWYHRALGQALGAAVAGKCLPFDAGSETWALKQLATVTPSPMNETQRANILDRKANLFEAVSTRNITNRGTVASGEYVDIIRGSHWLHSDIALGMLETMTDDGNPKIPQDDDGIHLLAAKLEASLAEAVRRKYLRSYTMHVPKESELSDDDRANRNLSELTFEGPVSGAFHTVAIRGRVTR